MLCRSPTGIADGGNSARFRVHKSSHEIDHDFVPSDRRSLPDWRVRVDCFCAYHRVVSSTRIRQSVDGEADAIYDRTLRETKRRLKIAGSEQTGFPDVIELAPLSR